MTQIGEIKRGSELGKVYYNKFIWHACVDCGRERWEEILGGQPRYLRCRRCGDKLRGNQGANNPRWKGGRFETNDGYIIIRLYPDDLYYRLTNSHHYVMEHRLIMAKHLGRVLYRYETVHHKNGVKNDNRLENLELRVSRHPSGQRVEDILEYAYWVINEYSLINKGGNMTKQEEIKTGANSETILCSMGKWKGKDISVTHQTNFCPIEGHALEVMHHYGEDGKHYCPTMFLMCPYCGGLADEPEPYECNKWGEK